jgi:EpsI family protein
MYFMGLHLPMTESYSCQSEIPDARGTGGPTTGARPITLAWILCVGLLILSGIAYQTLARSYHQILAGPISLPVPLSRFPQTLGDWAGQDMNIPATTQEYMRVHFADDYFSRRYRDNRAGQWADLYVVYCSSQPSGIVGHKPTVCYPGNGWIWDQTTPSQFVTRSNRKIGCLVHRFHKSTPGYQETVVVNFYVLNGHISTEEQGTAGFLSRFFSRRPNVAGDPARYVAQVQVASEIEDSAKCLACDATDTILSFLPDVNGVVGAERVFGPRPTGTE